MIFPILLADGIEGDLEIIAGWIEGQRSGFGLKFIETFEFTVGHLSQFPYSYSLKRNNCRCVKLGRFSYVLIYKIVGKTVLIARIVHTSRHPRHRYVK
jgi:toxin ParE1/3/4